MKNIILSLGISIDGYIAKKDGDVSWMAGDGSSPDDNHLNKLVENTIKKTGIIVMGRDSYEKTSSFGDLKEMFKGVKKFIVLTTRKLEDKNVEVFSGNVKELVEQENDGIWVFGGGNVAKQFLENDLVTQIELGIVPITLGKGLPLWHEINLESKWKLDDINKSNGIVQLKYSKR